MDNCQQEILDPSLLFYAAEHGDHIVDIWQLLCEGLQWLCCCHLGFPRKEKTSVTAAGQNSSFYR